MCLFPQFPEYDDLYCKYCFVYGQDWAPTAVSWAFGLLYSLQDSGFLKVSVVPLLFPV